jgi:hypothetical protein
MSISADIAADQWVAPERVADIVTSVWLLYGVLEHPVRPQRSLGNVGGGRPVLRRVVRLLQAAARSGGRELRSCGTPGTPARAAAGGSAGTPGVPARPEVGELQRVLLLPPRCRRRAQRTSTW